MTDHDAFLAAIRASPSDDLPRLVFADYLDDAGENELAAFIRFQCDPRHQGPHNGTWEYAVAERNVEKWFGLTALSGRKRNRKGFDWYFSDYGPPNLRFRWGRRDEYGERVWVELPIRRGFFESAECPARWWLQHGDGILSRHPVRAVRLTSRPRWEQHPTYGDSGYARLVGRGKIECMGCIVGSTDDAPLIRKLLAAEWPGVEFELPAEPQRRGLVVTLPPDWLFRDYAGADFAAAREAGRQSAMRHQQAILDRILGDS